MEWRVIAISCHRLETSAGGDQHARSVEITARRSPVQGSHAVALCGVHVGALLEQQTYLRGITAHGGVGYWRVGVGAGERGRCSAHQHGGAEEDSKDERTTAPNGVSHATASP